MPASRMNGFKLPDEKFLAFAVCIVESRPKELTIEEYISLLRQHIAKGRRENALSAVHRHLDRSSYWRAEYDRMREALESAEKEKLDLKLQVDRLKAKGDAGPPTAAAKKRKKQEDPDVIPAPRSPKRLNQAPPEKSSTLTPLNVDAGFDFAHLGETGDVLMRSFYQAHALLKSRERTEPTLLAHQLVSAANAVSDTLQTIAEDTRKDVDALKAALTAVSRAIQSLLVGYGRISNVAGGSEVQGHIVYAYVQIFEKSLSIMTELARVETERSDQDELQPAARPTTSKSKAKPAPKSAPKQRKVPALSALTSFVASTIELLDAKTESHKPLFEGLTYVLIKKLATCLYTVVFGRTRGASIEEDIEASARPDDIEEADQVPASTAEQTNVKTAKMEAPYLIQILTRLMQAAPAHFGASVASKSGRSKGASKQYQLKDNLAITAKERLQRTLVNCMFGEDGVDEEDPFLDCLRKPISSGSLPSMPVVKEAGIQEWFKEEVWRLLGWDILSRDGGW